MDGDGGERNGIASWTMVTVRWTERPPTTVEDYMGVKLKHLSRLKTQYSCAKTTLTRWWWW